MNIRRIKVTQVMEWQKRLLTEEEADELLVHLDVLYGALAQADMMINAVLQGETWYNQILEPIQKTQEEIDEERKLPPRKTIQYNKKRPRY